MYVGKNPGLWKSDGVVSQPVPVGLRFPAFLRRTETVASLSKFCEVPPTVRVYQNEDVQTVHESMVDKNREKFCGLEQTPIQTQGAHPL